MLQDYVILQSPFKTRIRIESTQNNVQYPFQSLGGVVHWNISNSQIASNIHNIAGAVRSKVVIASMCKAADKGAT